jgi:Radical SAM superfamily
MEIAIVMSAKCNAACAHCTTSCGPTRTETLSESQICQLMDDAARIGKCESLSFHITGGEPFLNFNLLLAVTRHGAGLGARLSCVTNAYWARTRELAGERLGRLAEVGLTALSVSVSRFHQQYVPLDRVKNALEAAKQLEIRTELKGAILESDLAAGATRDQWRAQLHADHINIFPILPFLREGVELPDSEYYREPGLPHGRCPGEIVCIEADGTAVSCCGPGSSRQFLTLGNVHRDSLDVINGRFEGNARQRLLRERGPIAFAEAAIEAEMGHLLRESYAGPCDLCTHIGTDPQLRAIAERCAAQSKTVPTNS